jgi:hypothetical protein
VVPVPHRAEVVAYIAGGLRCRGAAEACEERVFSMAVPLSTLWFGMDTRGDSAFGGTDRGTNDKIVLQVTRNDSVDILESQFGGENWDSPQPDQEAGIQNVYSVDVSNAFRKIVPEEIQSIRVGIGGGDAWNPDFLVVWGERVSAEPIIPLAIEINPRSTVRINPRLTLSSGDFDNGVISFTIRPVGLGGAGVTITSLLLMVVTADRDSAGTNDTLHLTITDKRGVLVADLKFGGWDEDGYVVGAHNPQQGGANLYWSQSLDGFFSGLDGVVTPFPKGRLKADSIQLSIEGDDAWVPQSLMLFGLDELTETDESPGLPTVLVPLVHLGAWDLGTMSTDSSEGRTTVILPLSP